MSSKPKWAQKPFGRAPFAKPSPYLHDYAFTTGMLAETLFSELERFPAMTVGDTDGLRAAWEMWSWHRPEIPWGECCEWQDWVHEVETWANEDKSAIRDDFDDLLKAADPGSGLSLLPLRSKLADHLEESHRQTMNLLWVFAYARSGCSFKWMQDGVRGREFPEPGTFTALYEAAEQICDELEGVRLACVGRRNPDALTMNVPGANLSLAATVATPPQPPRHLRATTRTISRRSGGSARDTNSRRASNPKA